MDATLAAQEKATELAARFSDWAWEDPARAAGLARVYNDLFNNLVLRSYDDARLSLPGLSVTFRPRPHQVAAVARMVGAGKTAEMIIGVTELRRLGLVRKPAVIVPNHMLEQFTREWLQLYPQAKVLAVSKDELRQDRRRELVARCATGTWDGVVITRSAFERIPLRPEAQREYMNRELDHPSVLTPPPPFGHRKPMLQRPAASIHRCSAPHRDSECPHRTVIQFSLAGARARRGYPCRRGRSRADPQPCPGRLCRRARRPGDEARRTTQILLTPHISASGDTKMAESLRRLFVGNSGDTWPATLLQHGRPRSL